MASGIPKSAMTNNQRVAHTSQEFIDRESEVFGNVDGKSAIERELPSQIYMSKDAPNMGALDMKS